MEHFQTSDWIFIGAFVATLVFAYLFEDKIEAKRRKDKEDRGDLP